MWFPIIAWIMLVCASAFFAGTTLDLDPAQISIHFAALPGPQRFALAAIIFATLSLIGFIRMASLQPRAPKQAEARSPQRPAPGHFGPAWIAKSARRGGPASRRERPRGSNRIRFRRRSRIPNKGQPCSRAEAIPPICRIGSTRSGAASKHFGNWSAYWPKSGG